MSNGMIDYKLCEPYINKACGSQNADNYHPIIFAIDDICAFVQLYENSTINEYIDIQLVEFCINNGRLNIFEHIKIKSDKDTIIKMLKEDDPQFDETVIEHIWD